MCSQDKDCLKRASGSRMLLLTFFMVSLIIVGIANFVLVKVLFVAFTSEPPQNASIVSNFTTIAANFTTALTPTNSSGSGGSRFSFFVNQGINFFYIVVGGFMVYPRMCLTKDITPDMRKVPHKIYLIMAALDSFGTFFISMGAVYTPGQIQPLLNQALIPLTMVFSCFMLRSRYNIWELLGAFLMLGGAALSIVPTITGTGGTSGKWCVSKFFHTAVLLKYSGGRLKFGTCCIGTPA